MRAGDIHLDDRRLETGWWGAEDKHILVLLHEDLGVFEFSRFGYGRSAPAPLPRPMEARDRTLTAIRNFVAELRAVAT